MENTKRNLDYTECQTDDEIDLYELFLILKKRKLLIFLTFLLITLLAVAYILFAPKVYKSEATIMPVGSENKLSMLSLMNLPLPIQDKSTSTIEVVLKSRTVKEKIIKHLNLLPILFKDKWDEKNKKWILEDNEEPPNILDGIEKLGDLIKISTDQKTGAINIQVDFKENPKMPYLIASTMLVETERILNEKSFTLSRHYREYLEEQILVIEKKLEKLEEIYKKFLRGDINRVPFIIYERDENGKIKIKKRYLSPEELEKIKSGFYNMESQIKRLNIRRDFINMQSYKFNLEKLNMQFKLLKDLFIKLLKEYEITKFKEKKEEIQFQIIDEPYIPDKPYKPKKKLILAVGAISGLFLGIFAAFFAEWLSNLRKRGGSNVTKEET